MESEPNILLEPRLVIGHIALDWLQSASKGTVLGVTSKGIFILLDVKQVIFLTNAKNAGPLNLIYDTSLPLTWKLHDEITIQIDEAWLIFNQPENGDFTAKYTDWKNPPADSIHISEDQQNRRMQQAVNQLRLLKNEQGFTSLLPHLLTDSTTNIPQPLEEIWKSIQAIRKLLPGDNLDALIPYFQPLFGFGRGLTPSGDDFVMGLTFLLNRFGHQEICHDWLSNLNRMLLESSYHKSNAISHSLLYCASLGSGNSRIQDTADWLMNGSIADENQVVELSRWGNSSGADLMAGMIVAIQTLQINKKGVSYDS